NETDAAKKVINMGCCSGVVTQAYGQPDNPVLSRGKDNPAILTAAPFRGLPQPEAHGRRMPAARNRGRSDFAVRFRVVP
ncbi:hypothetical protein LJD49_28160, partial [Escherichia coli]|uniref:hypothetical protein n=1 Tax=Escherichia coli TaxID=562 RepID=UPI001D0AC271